MSQNTTHLAPRPGEPVRAIRCYTETPAPAPKPARARSTRRRRTAGTDDKTAEAAAPSRRRPTS